MDSRIVVFALVLVVAGCVGVDPDVGQVEGGTAALSPMLEWPEGNVLADHAHVRGYTFSYEEIEGPRTYDSRIILYTEPGERVATLQRRTTPEGRTTRLFEPGIGHVATFHADGHGDPAVELSPQYQALTGSETIGCLVACLNCKRNGDDCLICQICLDNADPDDGPCDPDTDPNGCECDPHFVGLDCGDGLLADLP